jgi:hypothetical protein
LIPIYSGFSSKAGRKVGNLQKAPIRSVPILEKQLQDEHGDVLFQKIKIESHLEIMIQLIFESENPIMH